MSDIIPNCIYLPDLVPRLAMYAYLKLLDTLFTFGYVRSGKTPSENRLPSILRCEGVYQASIVSCPS